VVLAQLIRKQLQIQKKHPGQQTPYRTQTLCIAADPELQHVGE